MVYDEFLRFLAIIALIECVVLGAGAYLYFCAFKQMKKTPIIGWIAGTLSTGAFAALMLGVFCLFPNHVTIALLIIAKLALLISALMFIGASLTPEEKMPKNIERLEKNIKQHVKNHQNGINKEN